MIYASTAPIFFSTLKEFRRLNGIPKAKALRTPAENRMYFRVLSAMGRHESICISNFNHDVTYILIESPVMKPMVEEQVTPVPTPDQGWSGMFARLDDLKFRAHLGTLGVSGRAIFLLANYSSLPLSYYCNLGSKSLGSLSDSSQERSDFFSFIAKETGLTVVEVMA